MESRKSNKKPKRNSGSVLIGYDLGNLNSQISYGKPGATEPETVSAVMGTEQYNIPTVLGKKPGASQWSYGKEALRWADMEEGILVENLFELALIGESVLIDGEGFDPVALLTLFVKRSLSLLSMEMSLPSDLDAIMFTVEKLDMRSIEVLSAVAEGLELLPEQYFFQSYRESIYQYIVHQPKELWNQHVLIFDYSVFLKAYVLESNRKTTPMVVFVEKMEYPHLIRTYGLAEEKRQEWSERFLEIAEQLGCGRMISAVFLLGDGFKEAWTGEFMKFLCRGRRVFQGNNMYSKGACHGVMEKRKPSEIAVSQVFLGEDKLKANIGMKVLRHGAESYFAVLDAGVNWYEIRNQYQLIMEEGNELSFIVTSLTGGVVTEQIITLEGLPERPARTTRLLIQIRMLAAKKAQVTVTDMGFGALFPASGKKWVRELDVTS